MGDRRTRPQLTPDSSAIRALCESEQRFRALFEHAPVGTYLIHPVTLRILDANELAARALGYTRAEMIGLRLQQIEAHFTPAEIADNVRRISQQGHDTFETRHRTKAGEVRDVVVTSSAVHVGGHRALLATAIDVTERRRAEAALRESEARLRLAVGVAQMGTWSFDHATGRLEWSQQQFTLLGIDPGSVEPSRALFLSRVHPDDRAMVDASLDAACARRACFEADFRILLPSGEVRWMTGRAVLDDGDPPCLRGVMLDVTTRKRAEETLLRSVHEREEFLSIASHELRTPLAALTLQLETARRMLDRGVGDDRTIERLAAKLDVALRQAGRLEELVGELLAVARVSSGRAHLERTDVDLTALVDLVVERLTSVAVRAGSAMHTALSPGVRGRWDRTQLDHLVTNLISNAIKYGRGAPIEIEVRAVGDAAVVTVRDHGIGIAPADHARIFERFERAAPTAYGGLGLGLYHARRIAEAHDGTLSVESAPEAGSTFTLRLPRAAEA